MIYYFSGTGNSEHIARLAASELDDTLADIFSDTPANGNGTLGLVMPVYAWGIPAVVDKFIKQTLPQLIGNKSIDYVWCILTHGDDMGYADRILRRTLKSVGMQLDAAFSLAMPNTYVCLPGFDVDSKELADKKVRESSEKVKAICAAIKSKKHSTQVVRGALPHIKTYIIRPLFNLALVTDRYFSADKNRCTNCGLCAKICPLHNIAADRGSVSWHGNCTGCLRCYHACPCNAIQFGWFTKGKGQKGSINKSGCLQ